jgi:hypothetical protein
MIGSFCFFFLVSHRSRDRLFLFLSSSSSS